jgi:hypothetical protein
MFIEQFGQVPENGVSGGYCRSILRGTPGAGGSHHWKHIERYS